MLIRQRDDDDAFGLIGRVGFGPLVPSPRVVVFREWDLVGLRGVMVACNMVAW